MYTFGSEFDSVFLHNLLRRLNRLIEAHKFKYICPFWFIISLCVVMTRQNMTQVVYKNVDHENDGNENMKY